MSKFYLLLFIVVVFVSSCTNNKNVNKNIAIANDFKEKQNYRSAIFSFKEALKLEKNNERKAMILRQIAILYLILDDKSTANFYFNKGIKISEKGSYYNKLNIIEKELVNNNSKKAKEILFNMKEIFSDSMEIYQILSFIYSGSYNTDDENLNLSLKYAEKSYDLNKNSVNTEQLASIYFMIEKFDKASLLFKKLRKSYPENKKYQFNYGQSLYFSGNEKEGLFEMQEASKRDDECKKKLNEIIEK